MKIILLLLTIISIIISLSMFIWFKKALDKSGNDEKYVKKIIKKLVTVDAVCIIVITICAVCLLNA